MQNFSCFCQLCQILRRKDDSHYLLVLFTRTAVSEVLVNRRVIVFIVGGVTYEESRAVHLLNKELGANVIVGGTSLLSFDTFLEDLRVACFV
jgi:Sec1 family